MKQILVMMVVLVGCSKDTPETSQDAEAEAQVASKPEPEPEPEPTPVSPADEKLIAHPIVERAVRESLEKPEGILTEADLEKVTKLSLFPTKITDEGLKDVAKLQKLETLWLFDTQVTAEGVAELKKALPNCKIEGRKTP